MQRLPLTLVSPKLVFGFLSAVVVSFLVYFHAHVDTKFPALTLMLGGGTPTSDVDSAISSLSTDPETSRRLAEFSAFVAPKGIPLHPSFNNYEPNDEYSHLDKDQDESIRRRLHFSNYLYRGYDKFVGALGLEESAKEASLKQKCAVFFDGLSTDNPDWEVRKTDGYNHRIDDRRQLLTDIKKKMNEEWGNKYKGFPDSEDGKYNIEKKYQDNVRFTLRDAQDSADAASIMRVFGKCFFNDDPDRDMDTYKTYSTKVYSYLKKVLPRYCRSGSSTCLEGVMPVFDENGQYTGEGAFFNPDTDNFLEFMRTKISGKGIVVSANSDYEKMLNGLIRVLRGNSNTLPIQIVHRGDLSIDTQKRLHTAATESMKDMFDREYSDEEMQILPDIDIMADAAERGLTFPPQDLWFVDISPCICDRYRHEFSKFGNKLLAYFLNSFKEIIFMDADSVPLVPTLDYFKTPEYLETGSHLFRDRSLLESTSYMQVNTILRLLPINDRSIDTLFGIPLVTNKTLGNGYMGGWYNLGEAGMIIVDRKRHFLSMLMLLQLGFSNDFSGGLLYGDKEFFWISFAMEGGEDYALNHFRAGAVGKSLPNTKFPEGADTGAPGIVSSHPGHVSADGRLLWINSGFEYCKKEGYQVNLDKAFYHKYSKPELQQLFRDPVRLQAVVVPPDIPGFYKARIPWSLADIKELTDNKRFLSDDRKKEDLLEDGQKIEASQRTWSRMGGCRFYDHVAYPKVTSFNKNELYDYGTYFEFSDEDALHHDFLGKIWLNLGQPKKHKRN